MGYIDSHVTKFVLPSQDSNYHWITFSLHLPDNYTVYNFEMDDSLEQPSASPDPIEIPDRLDADDENSSGDEDGGLDWTKLP